MGGGKNAASKAAAESRARERERQQQIRTGTGAINKTFGQFDRSFYGGRRQAFLDYAKPQLQEQHKDAKEQLLFSLARNGTLDSSVRNDKEAELAKLFGQRRQQVADEALGQATTARNSVEGARGDLLRTLQSTADATGAARQATNRAELLTQPQQYSPLADLFGGFTASLGPAVARERMEAYMNGGGAPSATGLFGTPSGAVTVRH